MILTVCPNPSIDCTIELDSLNVGKLNRIRNRNITYAGKAINVAIGVARLGEVVYTTGFLAKNQAKMFEQTLDGNGVRHEFVYTTGNARVNYKIIDKKSMLTELNDKGGEITKELQGELVNKVKELSKNCSVFVMSGSLPNGVSADFYGEVINAVDKNVKIIADAEKDNIDAVLKKCKVFMVKPNIYELQSYTGDRVSSKADIVKSAKKYLDNGVENVLVSMGADGAVLTDGTNSYYCKSASVAVNSTVGAGDSMISAVCTGLCRNVDKAELLKMAVAAGTAAVTSSGTNLFYRYKYQEIYSKIFVEKI